IILKHSKFWLTELRRPDNEDAINNYNIPALKWELRTTLPVYDVNYMRKEEKERKLFPLQTSISIFVLTIYPNKIRESTSFRAISLLIISHNFKVNEISLLNLVLPYLVQNIPEELVHYHSFKRNGLG
ncbi:hypothetical protein Avbf_09735, partial [Armadillidium vulgare]